MAVVQVGFSLLGGMTVCVDNRIVPQPPPRVHGLLALLLLEPVVHSRARLAEQLRPDLDASRARQRVNSMLWLVRRGLPFLSLDADDETVCIPKSGRELDVERFRGLAAAAGLDHRKQALNLYRGQLLPKVELDWVAGQRDVLHSEYAGVAREVAADFAEAGRHEQALAVLQRLCEHESVDEEPLRLLLRAAHAAGRPGIGLRAFERHRRRAADLGLPPDDATLALVQALHGPAVPDDARPRMRSAATGAVPKVHTTATSAWHRAPSPLKPMLPRGSHRADARLDDAARAMGAGDVHHAQRILSGIDHPRAWLWQGRLARSEGRTDEATAHLRRAQAAGSDDPPLAASALVEQARVASLRGRGHLALAFAGEAKLIAADHGMPDEMVGAEVAMAAEHIRRGLYAQAIVALRPLGSAAASAATPLNVEVLCLLAVAGVARGALAEGLELVERAIAGAQRVGRPAVLAECHLVAAHVHRRMGEHSAARRALRRSLAIGSPNKRAPVGRTARAAVEHLAITVDQHDGDTREELLLRDPVIRRNCATNPALAAPLLGLQGALHQRAGRHDAACVALRAARRDYEQRGEPHRAAAVAALAVESLIDLGDLQEAEAIASQLDETLQVGLVPADLEPQLFTARARWAAATGWMEQAQAHAAAATSSLGAIAAAAPGALRDHVTARDRVARALRDGTVARLRSDVA